MYSSWIDVENKNFKLIVSYGTEALPFIFKSLKQQSSWLVCAVFEILGKVPFEIPEEGVGRLDFLIAKCLEYARMNGYL